MTSQQPPPQRALPQGSRRPAAVTLSLMLLCALLAAAPLWGPGIVNTRGGGDSPFLLQRTLEMAENLQHGHVPPRWMAHAAYDLGYPFFNHYAALPYYLSGGLTALGVNVLSAIQITQTLGFLLAALTMDLWTRRRVRSRAARLLAVVAYTFAPFHMVNVYVRGDSLSEFYAFVWYPLILWTIDRCVRRPSAGRIFVGGLSYGALILTHNVSAMIFSPFAMLYAVGAVVREAAQDSADRGRTIQRASTAHRVIGLAAIFVVGVLLTAWFWIPAVLETGYGQLGPAFTGDYFHYTRHFRGLDLVQLSPAFSYTVAATVDSAGPFAMGMVQAILALLGSVSLVIRLVRGLRPPRDASRRSAAVDTVIVLIGLLGATLMITPLSKPLWDQLPLLELTQFPWRFLSVQALFTAAVTATLAEPHLGPRPRRLLVLVAAAGSLAIAGASLATLRPDRLLIRPEDVTWDNLLLYESFTGNIGTTIRYEYLPSEVVPRLYISEAVVDGSGRPIAAGPVRGMPDATLVARTPTKQTWEVTLEEATAVTFPMNWWPGWRARVNGTPADTYAMPGSGRLTVSLPAGTSTVILRLGSTPLRTGALLTSLATGLAMVSVLVLRRRHRPDTQPLVGAAASGGALLLLASLPALLLQAPPDQSATFFDFDQMPYPHQGPIDFGPLELTDVAMSSHTAAPGTALETVLHWSSLSASSPTTATLRLVSPAEPRRGVPYAVAAGSAVISPETRITLPLPEDLTRGLYLLQIQVDTETGSLAPRTSQGRTMGPLYIGAIRVPVGAALDPELTPVATFQDLALYRVHTEQTEPTELSLELGWSTPGTPRNWRYSLRLLDAEGRLIRQLDEQPGYGYLPTTLWRPGEQVIEYPRLPLPEGLAPGEYTLRILTYLQATMEGGGQVDVPVHLDQPVLYDLRTACCEQVRKGATILCQTDHADGAHELALLGIEKPDALTEGEALQLVAEWNALREPTEDFSATWTLVGPHGNVISVIAGPIAPGSRTSEWPRHAWVLSPVTLEVPTGLEPGIYTLTLTLQGASSAVTCEEVAEFAPAARPRAFTVPSLPFPQRATFGEAFTLLGYDLRHDPRADTLDLTVWWQALRVPAQDYKRFVHLYDPATEEVVSQNDAMPRDWTYPTTQWVEGEVVSETITLDVSTVTSGAYRLGLGWYDPDTLNRLPADNDTEGTIRDNRVTLEAVEFTGRDLRRR